MSEILQIVLLIASIINNVIGIIQTLKMTSNKKTSNHRDVCKKNKKKIKH